MTTRPYILGVGYSHNGAACLLRGDELVVAIQEERVSGVKRARIRHHEESLAVRYCLDHAGIAMSEVDLLVVCHFSGPVPPPLARPGSTGPLPRRYLTVPHHLGHAHAVFATSGFDEAAILIVDGQGGTVAHLPDAERVRLVRGRVPGQQLETEVISLYRASRGTLSLLEKHTGEFLPGYRPRVAAGGPRSMPAFGSLGGMYSAVADLVFGDPLEAGKVMGLAPYGTPSIPPSAFYSFDDEGALHYHPTVPARFQGLAPWPQEQERYAELAASVQAALEAAVVRLAERARELSGCNRLCYAGGVALNSITNEVLHTRLGFDDVYVMPASDDSGTAIGAAFHGLATLTGALTSRRLAHDSTGRTYAAAELDAAITATPHVEVVPCADLLDAVVDRLCAGDVLGWFQGGSELGPRALGQRSILCDARHADAKTRLNDRVKHREAFRPFAPAILREDVDAWFATAPACDSPAMLRILRFQDGQAARVPAAAHVDGTGRAQTVTTIVPDLHALLVRYRARTGVPILVNTSFNVAGEPIVESPEDALWCLLATDLDGVVLGDRLVRKVEAQRSLLQLYPRLIARSVQITFPITNHALRLRAAPDAPASVTTATRHGELVLPLRAAETNLLAACDGTRDGWQVLEALQRTQPELTEARLVRRLGFYRRTQVLAFATTPSSAA